MLPLKILLVGPNLFRPKMSSATFLVGCGAFPGRTEGDGVESSASVAYSFARHSESCWSQRASSLASTDASLCQPGDQLVDLALDFGKKGSSLFMVSACMKVGKASEQCNP